MNVICPECNTTYRVDPAKVPSGGILAQCARCPATFEVAQAGVGYADDVIVTVEPVISSDEDQVPIPDAGPTFAVTADVFVTQPAETRSADAGTAGPVGEEATEATADAEVSSDESGTSREGVADEAYAGAADVAFHTGESAADDLPYLEASLARTARELEGADPTAIDDESPVGWNATSGTDVASPAPPSADTEARPEPDPVPQPASTSSSAPGETPLPPAPFGARSDPHRRAARLARALVSDIVVYHPERRTRSLRQGTLRQEFREEIRKSWEEYANQVGSDFARQTTYFRDALNEILAEGATVF